jgi:hypothetical protein
MKAIFFKKTQKWNDQSFSRKNMYFLLVVPHFLPLTLFRLHTTNDATIQKVEASALIVEQATTQQQRWPALIRQGYGG